MRKLANLANPEKITSAWHVIDYGRFGKHTERHIMSIGRGWLPRHMRCYRNRHGELHIQWTYDSAAFPQDIQRRPTNVIHHCDHMITQIDLLQEPLQGCEDQKSSSLRRLNCMLQEWKNTAPNYLIKSYLTILYEATRTTWDKAYDPPRDVWK